MRDIKRRKYIIGFTLIELLVVIAIIAVLAAIVAPNAFRAIEKAKIARVVADAKAIKTAALAYYADVGLWPPDVCPGQDPGFMRWDAYNSNPGCPCGGANNAQLPANFAQIIQNNWNGPYLEKFPRSTPWGGSYDWQWWPNGGITGSGVNLPPGCYITVDQIYDINSCGRPGNAQATQVPGPIEVKLQQEGIDEVHPLGVNTPDGDIIIRITNF